MNKYTEYNKKYIYSIKKKKYTNEWKKAEALWQTLRLSSASYDGLIPFLSIPRDY